MTLTFIQVANRLRRLELLLANDESNGDGALTQAVGSSRIDELSQSLAIEIARAVRSVGVDKVHDLRTIQLTVENSKILDAELGIE